MKCIQKMLHIANRWETFPKLVLFCNPEYCVICAVRRKFLEQNNCIIVSHNMHPLFQIYRVAAALMVTKPALLWKVVQLLRFTVKPSVKHNTLWAHSSADKEPKLFREGLWAEVFISPLGVSEGEGVSERGGGTGESFWVGSREIGKRRILLRDSN